MIEARHITVEVSGKKLLADVSAKVAAGETVAVVGPNGAGKSTLRRALCADVQVASGEVWMNGRRLEEWTIYERAQVRAVLPQDSTLSFPFTVLEVVLMGRTPHIQGAEGPRDYEIARSALDAVEARHLEERLYPTLSGGERQRVQLARVLAQIWEAPEDGTRYLLLDEPTSNLDLAHQHSALSVAHALAREGAGVLVILHDLNLAAQYADRIVMLKQGRITASGRPADVFTLEAIQETFDIPVIISKHPHLDCPLIIPVPSTTRTSLPL